MVLVNACETRAILGDASNGRLWYCDIKNNTVERIALSNAHVKLKAGKQGYFVAIHRYIDLLKFSIHNIEEPRRTISELSVRGQTWTFDGDLSAWQRVPLTYVIGRADDNRVGPFVLFVEPAATSCRIEAMSWYDQLYFSSDGVADVMELPHRKSIVFSLYGSSTLVIYDPMLASIISKPTLLGDAYTPQIMLRADGSELWGRDLDTLTRFRTADWSAAGSVRLQQPTDPTYRVPLGAFSLTADESICVVARPHNNDVVIVDAVKLEVMGRVAFGTDKPIVAAFLTDGKVIARDAVTADLLVRYAESSVRP